MERPLPKPNEVWERFDGKHYRIIGIGHHERVKDENYNIN